MPTVYNAANERAVALFLQGKIKYLDIPDIIEECMKKHQIIDNPNLEEILEVEQKTYLNIDELLK